MEKDIAVMGKKILVVDDEPDVLMVITTRLKANQYDVVTAQDGLAAIETVQRERPDLILADVLMPNCTGYEFVSRLRSGACGEENIPVIVISARESMEDFFGDVEIFCFMKKPLEMPELMKNIEAALGGAVRDTTGSTVETIAPVSSDKQAAVLVGLEEYVLNKLQTFLEKKGLKVSRALDENDAIRRAKAEKPDIVFAQYWEDRENMDASKIYQELSKDGATKNIPVIPFCIPSLEIDALAAFGNNQILGYKDTSELLKKVDALLKTKAFTRA